MKIIKESKFEQDWKGECSNCGSIFEADVTELGQIYIKDKDIKVGYCLHHCMVCGTDASIVFYQKSYYDELNQYKKED